MSDNREIEVTLMICADHPQALADRIASLTSITTYQLLPHPLAPLLDLYLDTPDRSLAARGLSLRLRQAGRQRWIALKGAARAVAAGRERMEIEREWSWKAWREVGAEAGLSLSVSAPDFAAAPLPEVIALAGLEVIQERETDRRVRRVVQAGESREVAELVIDSVTYRFAAQRVRLHEVEIESKAEAGPAALISIAQALLARFGPALRRWDHGKLTTGRAIEAMLEQRRLDGLLDVAHNLKPEAFEQIDRFIARNL